MYNKVLYNLFVYFISIKNLDTLKILLSGVFISITFSLFP